MTSPLLMGCDFSSSPSRRKPVVLAVGKCAFGNTDGHVTLSKLECFESLPAFAGFLADVPEWLGAFDLPFGLPRELVQALGWPQAWLPCLQHFASLTRPEIRTAFKSFCDARPAGRKFAHRATDVPAGSSPSMKWVNPPVAFMMHAGVPLLLQTGASLPGLHPTPAKRIALEAYPGMLIRELIGRQSYKSDTKPKQTPERRAARVAAVQALEEGKSRLGITLILTAEQRFRLIEDASGDSLDAVACLVQAAWAARRAALGDSRYGWPHDADPLEGWILTA